MHLPDSASVFLSVALASLLGFLLFKQLERARQRRARRPAHPAPVGHPIDVTPLRPGLKAVRRDFSAAAHNRARAAKSRYWMLAEARRRLGTLGFFRHPLGDD